MSNYLVRTSISAIAIVGALSLGASGAEAQKKILRADTGSPGAVSHAVIVVLGKVWQKELGITIQINDSQTLTRSAMKLGRGQLEIMPFPTSIYEFMSKGSRMYKKKLHNEAIAASKNVRSIWGWQAVVFHPVTFDIAGINRLVYDASVRIIPLRCLGSLNIILVRDALARGIDGVILMGCRSGDDYQCHFMQGSELAEKRLENIQEALVRQMIEPERVKNVEIEISDYEKIPAIINEFAEEMRAIGPNPYKGW